MCTGAIVSLVPRILRILSHLARITAAVVMLRAATVIEWSTMASMDPASTAPLESLRDRCLVESVLPPFKAYLSKDTVVLDPREVFGNDSGNKDVGADADLAATSMHYVPAIYNTQADARMLGRTKMLMSGSNINADGIIRLPQRSVPSDYLTVATFNKAILNLGDIWSQPWQSLHQKLKGPDDGSGAKGSVCLVIMVLGGSISCGHTSNSHRADAPTSMTDSFGAHLETILNENYPCNASWPHNSVSVGSRKKSLSKHEVHNRCEGGSGTSHWIDVVASWKSDPTDAIHAADLILIDTAVNDYEFQHKLRGSTELLVRLLESVNDQTNNNSSLTSVRHRPALLWISVSSTSNSKLLSTGLPENRGNSALEHLHVTSAYGISHVSIIDAFHPMDSQVKRYWFDDIYKGDKSTHLSKYGPYLVSGYLFYFIELMACMISSPPPAELLVRRRARVKELGISPLFASPGDILLYTTKVPYQAALHTSQSVDGLCNDQVRGFRKYADVGNKFGFIGLHTGDQFTLILPSRSCKDNRNENNVFVQKNCGPRELRKDYSRLRVEYLASYAGMGVMKLTLRMCDEDCIVTKDSMGSYVGMDAVTAWIDTLDTSRNISISRSTHIDIPIVGDRHRNDTVDTSDRAAVTARHHHHGHDATVSNVTYHYLFDTNGVHTNPHPPLKPPRTGIKNYKPYDPSPSVSQSQFYYRLQRCDRMKLTVEIVPPPSGELRAQNKVKMFAVTLF
jgi:hypothetical protein